VPFLRSSWRSEYFGAPDTPLSGRSDPERVRNPSGKFGLFRCAAPLVFRTVRTHRLQPVTPRSRLFNVSIRKAPRALPTCREMARWNAG
jgi:hypothetical protein